MRTEAADAVQESFAGLGGTGFFGNTASHAFAGQNLFHPINQQKNFVKSFESSQKTFSKVF